MAYAITKKEVQFASALIKALGGNSQNGYLLRAFIAWLRGESGQRYIGNNPLNIRRSPFAIGYRQGPVGKFAIFRNLAEAGKATAYFLKNNRGYGYEQIIAAARRGAAGQAAMVEQARDVLAAIGMSKWSATNYGSMRTGHYEERNNRLATIWYGLTGLKIPDNYFAAPPAPRPAKPKPKRKVEHQVPPTQRELQRPGYIPPYGARIFYGERPHLGEFVLPNDAP